LDIHSCLWNHRTPEEITNEPRSYLD
jgi:hypothetical protein